MVSTKEIFYVSNCLSDLEREIQMDKDIAFKKGDFNHHSDNLQEELIKREEGSDIEVVLSEIRIINRDYRDCKRRTK